MTDTFIYASLAGVIAAAFTVLGLSRLKTIDAAIEDLRKSIRADIDTFKTATRQENDNFKTNFRNEVSGDIKDRISSGISAETSKIIADFENSRKEAAITTNNRLEERIKSATTEIEGKKSAALQSITDSFVSFDNKQSELDKKYGWLSDNSVRSVADALDKIETVEQAHESASAFRSENNNQSALAALMIIHERALLGGGDEFHNAQAEAATLGSWPLAILIIRRGLELMPNNPDLAADLCKALEQTGKAREGFEYLKNFRGKFPKAFYINWRPATFLLDAAEASGIADEYEEEITAIMEDGMRRIPREHKFISGYARWKMRKGSDSEAWRILDFGLTHRPSSQQLKFVKGEWLLHVGNYTEAEAILEDAISLDVPFQFQHDVSQSALLLTLAQAKEAVKKYDEASRCYQLAAGIADKREFKKFAATRLAMQHVLGLASANDEASDGEEA